MDSETTPNIEYDNVPEESNPIVRKDSHPNDESNDTFWESWRRMWSNRDVKDFFQNKKSEDYFEEANSNVKKSQQETN